MTEFEKIYRACFADVYRYLTTLTHNASLAEELTSETFFRAMRALDSFRGDCEVRVWLCGIAKNCYYSHLKKQKRHMPDAAEEAAAASARPALFTDRSAPSPSTRLTTSAAVSATAQVMMKFL